MKFFYSEKALAVQEATLLFEKTSETSLQHGISERERPEALTALLSCWLLARFTSCLVVPNLGIACPWQLRFPADTRRRHGLSRASESQVFLAGQTRRDYSPFSSDLSPSLPPSTTGETRERLASVPDPQLPDPDECAGARHVAPEDPFGEARASLQV